jgi:dTDP-4-dehydrorhamnose reductase
VEAGRPLLPRRKAEGCRELGDRRRLLINGATGTLGRAFSRIADHRGLDHQLLSRKDMDIADPGSVAKALACHKPWAVVNTAGFVRVADAERERDACFRENVEGAEVLARACADAGIPFVTFSSDLVFDGRARPRPMVRARRKPNGASSPPIPAPW